MLLGLCVLICSAAVALGVPPPSEVLMSEIPTPSPILFPTTTTPAPSTTSIPVISTERSNVDGSAVKSKDSVDENKKLISQNLTDIFYQTTGNKFYVSKVWKNWDDAERGCKDVGMELASITTQKEQLELFKFLFVNDLVPEDDFSGYWLSGHKLNNDLYKWTAINTHINCWGWLEREPNLHNGEECLELKLDSGKVRLGWNNVECKQERRFLCQKPIYYKDNLDKLEESLKPTSERQQIFCYYSPNRWIPRIG